MDKLFEQLSEKDIKLILEGEGEFPGLYEFFDWLETKKYKIGVSGSGKSSLIDDISKLLHCFGQLIEAGNLVIVIEHNLDVIKYVDYIIDLGPEGCEEGGKIVPQGTPEDIIKCEASYTGKFLKTYLN